jgi:hypothetical protein
VGWGGVGWGVVVVGGGLGCGCEAGTLMGPLVGHVGGGYSIVCRYPGDGGGASLRGYGVGVGSAGPCWLAVRQAGLTQPSGTTGGR